MEALLLQRLREGRLSGILNGVDPTIWHPKHDLLLSSRYHHDSLEAKAENKRQLQIAMGLRVDDKAPVFAVVSRLTKQKGLDLVLEALPGLLEQGDSWCCWVRVMRNYSRAFLPPRRKIPAMLAYRLAITKPFPTALWAARM